MKLTLQKARKVESKVQELVKQGEVLKKTVSVRVKDSLSNITALMDAGNQDFLESKKSYQGLVQLVYSIRRKIEKANEEKGLNELMNQRMLKTTLHSAYMNLIKEQPALTNDHLNDFLELKKTLLLSESSGRIRTPALNEDLSVILEENIEELKKETVRLKKEIGTIEDRLQALNNSVEIELTPDQVALLEQFDFV